MTPCIAGCGNMSGNSVRPEGSSPIHAHPGSFATPAPRKVSTLGFTHGRFLFDFRPVACLERRKPAPETDSPTPPIALNPQAVSVLNADARRTFLFRLTTSEAKEARVLRLLAEAGCFADLGNETLFLFPNTSYPRRFSCLGRPRNRHRFERKISGSGFMVAQLRIVQ